MGQNTIKISPKIKLYDIFGRDLILNPRPPFSNDGWLPKNPAKEDLLTGAPLPIAGNLPVICSDTVITGEILSLLEKANLEAAPLPYIYRSEKDYRNLLASIKRQNKRLAFNHVHPPNELGHEGYWIDPELLAYLNNKANLSELVPLGYVPQRMTIHLSEMKKTTGSMKLPFVIKAVTRHSTGGGYGLVICRFKKDINHAYNYFGSCERVVIEEFIKVNKIYNTQFAKTVNGQIIYLGTSEQITTSSGNYLGNWIVKKDEPPKIVMELGREIMECACRLGFIGIAGFDIVISRDNRVLVIDLNFRLNGSTPLLLLQDSIMRIKNASVLMFRTWKTRLEWNTFLSLCKEFIEAEYLIPLSIYNSAKSPYPCSVPCFTGVLAGSSREDILKKESLLAKHGIK